jgi:hypothetical protein
MPQTSLDWEMLYLQLGQLVASLPELRGPGILPTETLQWLARADLLISQACDLADQSEFRAAASMLHRVPDMRNGPAGTIEMLAHRALAQAKARAPVAIRGTFIPVGGTSYAFAVIAKVLGTATTDLLVVDPYMDARALMDCIPAAPAGIPVRLLADRRRVKPSLRPAVQRWLAQYGAQRPIEARLAAPWTLHDRLIVVDGRTAWVLTQSLSAFAARAPGQIEKTNPDAAALKIPAYESIWNSATPLWSRSAIIVGDLLGRLGMLRIECPKCGRLGRYRLADLIMRYGREEKVFAFTDDMTANCTRRNARSDSDPCGAICPDLPKVM